MHAAGTAGILIPVQIAPAKLETAIRGLQALGNIDGIVITVPHKMTMMRLVDEVLPTGQRIGAINAVRREADGSWVGDNFDGKGFVAGLRKNGHEPRGKRALLVGAGGAGSPGGFGPREGRGPPPPRFDAPHAQNPPPGGGTPQGVPGGQ